MLEAFVNTFKIPDLRKKILLTLALIAVYRVGTYIPTPGVDGAKLAIFFNNLARSQGGALFGEQADDRRRRRRAKGDLHDGQAARQQRVRKRQRVLDVIDGDDGDDAQRGDTV